MTKIYSSLKSNGNETNIEINLLGYGGEDACVGLNLTDSNKEKSNWVEFSVQDVKKIIKLLTETTKELIQFEKLD